MGTELIKRNINLNKYIWSASENINNPELIYNIHKEYINSGADYITTNTFRATPRAYYKYDKSKNYINKAKTSFIKSVEIAKRAAEKSIQTVGSIAPLEDCYLPQLFPGKKIAYVEFSQLADWFCNIGVDVIMLETMNSIVETEIALKALDNVTMPLWVSFIVKDEHSLLSGDLLINAYEIIKKYNVCKILFNCANLNITYNTINNIVNFVDIDWGIYPNLGKGVPASDGVIKKYYSIKKFINIIQHAINNGASIVGACCGSSPMHINEIYKLKNNNNI